jgi:hypothetical protein
MRRILCFGNFKPLSLRLGLLLPYMLRLNIISFLHKHVFVVFLSYFFSTKKKKRKKYNLASQTTTVSSNDPPNYQGLHSGPPNYQDF